MNGDRDVANVSRSANLRTSSSPYRKCAKGCSPSKPPLCSSSFFSSSTSKGQSMYSGRRGTRSSISETLLLPADSDRKRKVGGKTPTKPSTILTFSTPNIVVEDGVKDDQQDLPLKPRNLEEDMEKSKRSSLSYDGFYEHVPDSLQQQPSCSEKFSEQVPDPLQQPSCSEKVSKWLEESQHSTMTDLSDNHSVSPDEDLEVNNRKEEDHEADGNATRVSEAEEFQDMTRPADNLPESIPTPHSPIEVPIDSFKVEVPIDKFKVEVPIDKFKGFSGLSLARLIIMGYLKVLMCLSVVYVGFLLRIRPTSWDNYEPPPT